LPHLSCAMACWKGVCKACRGRREGIEEAQHQEADDRDQEPGLTEPTIKTFTAEAPSASYQLVDKLDRVEKERKMPASIPDDLKVDLQTFREELVQRGKEDERKAKSLKEGPESPPGFFELTVIEQGVGHRKPLLGGKVKIAYMIVTERDESVLDMQNDFDYVLGQGVHGAGQVMASVLDGMLVQMRRGQVASITHSLDKLFPASAPALMRFEPSDPAVCEVKLLEIYSTKDVSFQDAGDVIKEVVKEGIGAWCDNPTDEGMAVLRIEEVRTSDGTLIYPEPEARALDICATAGDGQVCDALECAMLEMRQHETALITCGESFFVGGEPFGNKGPAVQGELTLRATLLDYNKGPDAASFDEEDRLPFALRRKVEANRLFGESRFRLARERYMKITDLFHHLDRPKVKDRFLGRPELFQSCRKLRLECRLNIAACSIKLQDPASAIQACDAVLWQSPENTKAFYRRAQAHMQQKDYVQACRDLQRLIDIDPSIQEAKRLLEKADKLRGQSDRKQKEVVKYDKMVNRIFDDRSDKYDYLDAPIDDEEHEGLPVRDFAEHGRQLLRRPAKA